MFFFFFFTKAAPLPRICAINTNEGTIQADYTQLTPKPGEGWIKFCM